MTDGLRKAYSVVCVILMLQYVLQLYLIAAVIFTITHANDNAHDIYAAFQEADSGFLGVHRANGDLAALLVIILLVLSFAARLPRRTIGLTALLFVLMLVQALIPALPTVVSALHGVNALLLIALTGYLTGTNWAFPRRAAATG